MLLPFVQAIASKAGEDVYQLIRGKLSRQGRKLAEAEMREAGVVTLADSHARIILRVPERLSPAMPEQIEDVRIPVPRDGWLLVVWDPALAQWVVHDFPGPPPAGNIPECRLSAQTFRMTRPGTGSGPLSAVPGMRPNA